MTAAVKATQDLPFGFSMMLPPSAASPRSAASRG